MKCSDIDADHVIDLARDWQMRVRAGVLPNPGVIDALVAEGVPEKVAYTKVMKLSDRGRLDYGVSPYYAWPA